ncbi:MAG: hypothetical protein A2W79_20445 [Pseudomonadales bacterium RIFCSPLOWO2_12_60_38]|uniref:hypothetical protein n=1 Tax=Pseudomonas TaxID=286 RepID=UPI000356FBD1|nr:MULTISPECIES: hypothetical protein [Pseudomonas]ETK39368.1 hypothetical protein H098_22865 [Pseudomonas fluorescens FH5]OHC32446.1 MAG: hypothetical protein A2W79_20445 [Pseudomonadales bacterium RIFCSPLOWO2_12_60_38]OHC41123.1 MAG: hypothetical protein A3G72_07700 [Pseudomonadales bacterium RIFCSPLOWO2_12_FULL_59_450]OKP67180.1 hypothetical protein BTR19_24230 [Pseudomonas fluorescens]EPJ81604.1 hypothetical protein CFT9_18880 [Pseudomonas sp. CFT9]
MLAKNVNDDARFQDEKWRARVFRAQARSYSGLFHFNLTIQASFLQRPVESPFRKNAEMQAYKVRDKLYTITHRCDATQSFHCPDATHTCYHEQEGRLQ